MENNLINFKKAVEASGEIVFMTFPNGIITFINPEFTRVYGYPADEVVNKVTPRILKSGKMNPIEYEIFWKKILNKEIIKNELINKTKYGRLIVVENSCNPILDEGKKIIGFLSIQRDVTEHKKIEKELIDKKTLADIGTLAATVAHELRNPLGVIQLAAYNIRKKAQNPLIEKHLGNIDKKVQESDQIINNLLFYSRLKMPNYEDTNIYNILEECITQTINKFQKWDVIIIKMYESLKDIVIRADSFQLKEVFNNILNNAYEAIMGKKGEIEIKGIYDEKENTVIISVKDNGIGIDFEDIKMLAEPFFTKKTKGTGLGLTVSYKIVNLHGGKIDIESRMGEGANFIITLPLKGN